MLGLAAAGGHKAGLHQLVAAGGIGLAAWRGAAAQRGDAVQPTGVESCQTHPAVTGVDLLQDQVIPHKGGRLVGGHRYPGGFVVGKGALQPPEGAELQETAVLFEKFHLPCYQFLAAGAELVRSSSYPKAPKKATLALVVREVTRSSWWLGTAATWAPILETG